MVRVPAVAASVARRLVVPPHRDGGQAQFIPEAVPAAADRGLAPVLDWALAPVGLHGPGFGLTAVWLVFSYLWLPYMILPIYAGLERLPNSLLEAAGTSATRRGHPLERLYRDARCGSLQPATSDVCADWLGVAVLGGDPENEGTAPRW